MKTPKQLWSEFKSLNKEEKSIIITNIITTVCNSLYLWATYDIPDETQKSPTSITFSSEEEQQSL